MRLSEAARQAATKVAEAQDLLLGVLDSAYISDDDLTAVEFQLLTARLSDIYDDLEDISLE